MYAIIQVTILVSGMLVGALDAQAGTPVATEQPYYQIFDGSCYDLADAEHMAGNDRCDEKDTSIAKNNSEQPYYQIVDGSCYDLADTEHMAGNDRCSNKSNFVN